MQVHIKRIDKTLPLPEYKTTGAVAFDLYTREAATIPAKTMHRIPSNYVIQVPEGYMLYIKDRSSMGKKNGLLATAGIIDQDYCGPNDELLFQVFNASENEIVVEKGERVAQGIFIPIVKAEWNEKEEMEGKDRGGFGTTGK